MGEPCVIGGNGAVVDGEGGVDSVGWIAKGVDFLACLGNCCVIVVVVVICRFWFVRFFRRGSTTKELKGRGGVTDAKQEEEEGDT